VIKLAVIFGPQHWDAALLRLFTGCVAYHVAWVDEERGLMYDMNLLRRRRPWPAYTPSDNVIVFLYAVPGVTITREYLEDRLTQDNSEYGVMDFVLFALRGFFHLIGKPTRNAKGVICSEMCNIDVWACGGKTPWKVEDAPPSPCDWWRWLAKN
jgi:hypothetical protein